MALDVLWFQIIVMYVIRLGIAVAGIFALAHLSRQRPDAYPVAEKLTKQLWLFILLTVVVVQVAFLVFKPLIVWNSLWIPALSAVAVMVYLVDVKPRVDEVQRGPRY